jgi:hypothetical protein
MTLLSGEKYMMVLVKKVVRDSGVNSKAYLAPAARVIGSPKVVRNIFLIRKERM